MTHLWLWDNTNTFPMKSHKTMASYRILFDSRFSPRFCAQNLNEAFFTGGTCPKLRRLVWHTLRDSTVDDTFPIRRSYLTNLWHSPRYPFLTKGWGKKTGMSQHHEIFTLDSVPSQAFTLTKTSVVQCKHLSILEKGCYYRLLSLLLLWLLLLLKVKRSFKLMVSTHEVFVPTLCGNHFVGSPDHGGHHSHANVLVTTRKLRTYDLHEVGIYTFHSSNHKNLPDAPSNWWP